MNMGSVILFVHDRPETYVPGCVLFTLVLCLNLIKVIKGFLCL